MGNEGRLIIGKQKNKIHLLFVLIVHSLYVFFFIANLLIFLDKKRAV